jgi:hypothetical protein
MSPRHRLASRTRTRSLALALAGVAGSTIAVASPARAEAPAGEIAAAPRERENSINLSPLGFALGSYYLNSERLFDGTHGVLVEGGFAHSADDSTSSTSLGGGLGYRWHWRGRQNSGFLGVNASFYRGTADASIESGGSEKSFDLDVTSYALTANVGKRWAWDNGLNVTFRIGGGYGNYDVTTDSTDPDAKEVAEDVDDFLTLFPIALDGELSLGYAF